MRPSAGAMRAANLILGTFCAKPEGDFLDDGSEPLARIIDDEMGTKAMAERIKELEDSMERWRGVLELQTNAVVVRNLMSRKGLRL